MSARRWRGTRSTAPTPTCSSARAPRSLLTPTLGLEAFQHGSAHPQRDRRDAVEPPWLDWCGLLYDANLAGLPACAVPIGLGDDGLPVSLQVLGPRGSDGAVLAAAEAIERLVEFRARPVAHLTMHPRS